MSAIARACGGEHFFIWDSENHIFGSCFEKLCFSITSHIILAIASSFYFSSQEHRRISGEIPKQYVLFIRLAVTISLAILPLILIIISLASDKIDSSMINILTWVISALSYVLHAGFVWRLRTYYHIHLRGPPFIVISLLLTILALAIHLYDVITIVVTYVDDVNPVEEYAAYVNAGLNFVYVITLIPAERAELRSKPFKVNSDGSINYQEYEQLVPSSEGIAEEDKPLGVAENSRNILSRLFLSWVNPLMFKGYKGKITGTTDLFDLPKGLETSYIEERFHNAIAKQDCPTIAIEHKRQNYESINYNNRTNVDSDEHNVNKTLSLLKALNTAFGVECWCIGILRFFGDSLNFAGPLLLNLLVSYMDNSNDPSWHGYVYASALCISTFLSSMFSTHFNYEISLLGLKIRAALITSVYKKALYVSSVSLSTFSSGEVVNFMSTDTDRIVNLAPSVHQFWSLPLQIVAALYLLYTQVGLAFLAGVGFAVLLIPVNRWLALKIRKLSRDMMQQKDARVKVMNEILFGIRVIKFYTWEQHFQNKIRVLRDAELKSLKGRKYLDALIVFFWSATPVLISILTFSTYTLMGNQLTAAKVFTSMALFNILIIPLNAFPWVINGLMEAWVSVKRLQKYLNMSEQDLAKYYCQYEEENEGITIKDASFSWQQKEKSKQEKKSDVKDEESNIESQAFLLRPITAKVNEGCTLGIVGKVGSGKSSLLNAILAEMKKDEGTITVSCLEQGFGYAAQESWIQHASVRDNILFGKGYDQERYESVLDACALRDDLNILPAGDQTEVGERGVTLSGGQKARVALARAVYQDKSVYLLDDPFAAVDTHVANHIFNNCIQGLLSKKTVILCTHHTEYLQNADEVIVLEDGAIRAQGTPGEILSSADLKTLVAPRQKKAVEDESPTKKRNVEHAGLVEKEKKDTGVVKFDVYLAYWNAIGKILGPYILLLFVLVQASKNIGDWWLSYWVSHSHNSNESVVDHHHHQHGNNTTTNLNQDMVKHTAVVPWSAMTYGDDNVAFYLIVYASIAGATIIFAFNRAFTYAYGGVVAATKIHVNLLSSILKAPIQFFDVTPVGRILNRFSSDLYAIDDTLSYFLNVFLAQSVGFAGTLILTCYGLPWFILLLIPLIFIYYMLQKYYRHTSREVKRVSSVSLSPIYAHFTETVTGLTTIRAHREQLRFIEANQTKLEENQKAQLAVNAASTWLNIRLQMIGVTMVTGVAFIAVLEHHFQSVNPGLVGLAITYALSITAYMRIMVQFFTETEKQMVSVERATQYIEDVPHESEDSMLRTPELWPNEGFISFRNIHLQYRDGLPFALNGVSFHINPAEKVGIVGRTGSGKSSLFLTLFRMVNIHSGEIEIDGVNIDHLSLQALRSKMAIIPQDPFLFSGTIRENLDPHNDKSDEDLDKVVDVCHLRDVVDRLGGLDAEVTERGKQFSVGQRQLVCLARAFLTDAKILCIDEATASVDKETDEKIQLTIKKQFINNTVLTIAHRISTIQESDRILVMDNGNVAEFDKPSQLLKDPKSLFYNLTHSSK